MSSKPKDRSGRARSPRYTGEELFAQRRLPETKKLFELIDDGHWHDREKLIKAIAPMIPPGVAWRYLEKQRMSKLRVDARKRLSPEEYEEWLKEHKDQPRDPNRGFRDLHQQVASGQRNLAIERIMSQVRNGRLERRIRADGGVEVRLRGYDPKYAQSMNEQVRREWRAEGRQFTEKDVRREANTRRERERMKDPAHREKKYRQKRESMRRVLRERGEPLPPWLRDEGES